MTTPSDLRLRLRRSSRYLPVLLGLIAAVFGAWKLKSNFYDTAAAEIIALVAVLMAGILPTAILSATVLRAGGLSVHKITRARDAILRQLDVWAGLFGVSAAVGVLLVIGKLLKWELAIQVDSLDVSMMPVLNGVITGSLVLLSLRMMTIFTGLRSLVVLSAEIAQTEAAHRDRGIFADGTVAAEAISNRKEFGKTVDLP